MIVIVMGVSGSGKSYFAERLAQATGWVFAEGDDYHSEYNKGLMKAGIALTDTDREPWLSALHTLMAGWEETKTNGILTCSALKATYRQTLTAGLADVRFVWLDPSRNLLEDHLAHRKGHYMSPTLLDSQLATLERPVHSPDIFRLDGTETPDAAVHSVMKWLGV